MIGRIRIMRWFGVLKRMMMSTMMTIGTDAFPSTGEILCLIN